MNKLANSSLFSNYFSFIIRKQTQQRFNFTKLSYQNTQKFWVLCDQPISGPFSPTFKRGGPKAKCPGDGNKDEVDYMSIYIIQSLL
jgi:hypothetical protein